jgi:hypothetical protein
LLTATLTPAMVVVAERAVVAQQGQILKLEDKCQQISDALATTGKSMKQLQDEEALRAALEEKDKAIADLENRVRVRAFPRATQMACAQALLACTPAVPSRVCVGVSAEAEAHAASASAACSRGSGGAGMLPSSASLAPLCVLRLRRRRGWTRVQIVTRAREMDAKMAHTNSRNSRKAVEKLTAQAAALQAELAEKEKEARASGLKVKTLARELDAALKATSRMPFAHAVAEPSPFLTETPEEAEAAAEVLYDDRHVHLMMCVIRDDGRVAGKKIVTLVRLPLSSAPHAAPAQPWQRKPKRRSYRIVLHQSALLWRLRSPVEQHPSRVARPTDPSTPPLPPKQLLRP